MSRSKTHGWQLSSLGAPAIVEARTCALTSAGSGYVDSQKQGRPDLLGQPRQIGITPCLSSAFVGWQISMSSPVK